MQHTASHTTLYNLPVIIRDTFLLVSSGIFSKWPNIQVSTSKSVWPSDVIVRVLDLQLKGHEFDPRPFQSQIATLGKLFTHVSLSSISKFGTSQRVVMPCGCEGNRKSFIALAVHHRLHWFIHPRTYGQRKGDEQPVYTPCRVCHTQWCIGGYTRVYGVYQPPGFFDSVYSPLSDHK